MSEQGTQVRGVVLGLACVSLAGTLVGCTAGGLKGDPATTVNPSNAEFRITVDTSNAPGTEIMVGPNQGDASLEAVKTPVDKQNKIVWTSDRTFAIKFVQFDDPKKSPSKKFGDEKDEWNKSGDDYAYTLTLKEGSGKPKKSIQGAKYIVKSPEDCDENSPGPNCFVLDPVLIVRY